MHLHSHHDAFLTYIAKYLGIALIAGSVVHIGTLQNGVTRYVVLIIIGLILTILGGLKEAKEHGQKINLNYFLIITGLSFATGFLSGGIQHYLDNPSYAGTLLGVGLVVTYIAFFLRDKLKLEKQNVAVVLAVSIAVIIFSHFVMDDALRGFGHHDDEAEIHSEQELLIMPKSDGDGAASMDMGQAMVGMTAGMKGKAGAELEETFLREMIVHHQGAVDMSRELLKGNPRPELAKFANDIIKLQTQEIEMQKQWLEQWYHDAH